MGVPGPHGMPRRYHRANIAVHTRVSAKKYGSTGALTVPIPERLS